MKKKLFALGAGIAVFGAIIVTAPKIEDIASAETKPKADSEHQSKVIPVVDREAQIAEAQSEHVAGTPDNIVPSTTPVEQAVIEVKNAFKTKNSSSYEKSEAVAQAIFENFESFADTKYEDNMNEILEIRASIGNINFAKTQQEKEGSSRLLWANAGDTPKPASELIDENIQSMEKIINKLK